MLSKTLDLKEILFTDVVLLVHVVNEDEVGWNPAPT